MISTVANKSAIQCTTMRSLVCVWHAGVFGYATPEVVGMS